MSTEFGVDTGAIFILQCGDRDRQSTEDAPVRRRSWRSCDVVDSAVLDTSPRSRPPPGVGEFVSVCSPVNHVLYILNVGYKLVLNCRARFNWWGAGAQLDHLGSLSGRL